MMKPALYPPPELRIPSPEEDTNPVNPFGVGLQDIRASGWFQQEETEIFPGMKISADDVLLDSGCGIGRFAGFCSRSGADVILIDENPETLEQARVRCAGSGARSVRTFVSDCDPVPLADASVTRVLCTEVLEHVDDPARVVAELARVGRKGALYLFTVPAPGREHVQERVAPAAYFQKPHHQRIFRRETLDTLIEGAGLEIETRTQNGFFWSVFFSIYWKTGYENGTTSHPALDHWTQAWRELLKTEGGLEVKHALDEALPNSLVTLARKP